MTSTSYKTDSSVTRSELDILRETLGLVWERTDDPYTQHLVTQAEGIAIRLSRRHDAEHPPRIRVAFGKLTAAAGAVA